MRLPIPMVIMELWNSLSIVTWVSVPTHIPLLWPTVWWLYLCSCKMRKENEILAVRSLEATDWPKQSQQATYPPFCISVAILYAPIKAVHTVAPQVILSIKMWNWDITVVIWAKSCNLGFMQSKTIFFRWTKFIVIKLKYHFCKHSLLNYIVFNNKKNVWYKKN